MDMRFWNGKRVFLTGHTGFKGSWLCRILVKMGVELTGYALAPPTIPNLFSLCDVKGRMDSIIGDIRDRESLFAALNKSRPDIVIHMAAQPLVKTSYIDPAYTYEVNVMGTINVLEGVRTCNGVRSLLNITTDKVYRNNEWEWGYREIDPLDGFDPYSNSKSCSELVTRCYKESFLAGCGVAVSTARAGNVIGGGDFAPNRIIPDCIRAASKKESIIVRNPRATRPYQHVLEPLFAYLMIAQSQYEDALFSDCYNVGPDDCDCASTGRLVDLFCSIWGEGQKWEHISTDGPHEAKLLKLDCSKIKSVFDWKPRWNIKKAVEKTVEWTKMYLNGYEDIGMVMDAQIDEFTESDGVEIYGK